MTAQNGKSWLLGGGYTWRTFTSAGVNIDIQKGISLTPVRSVPPPAPVAKTIQPRYSFARLGYDIHRNKREVLAYTRDGRLRHRWGPRDGLGNYVDYNDPTAWDPIDIAGDANCVFILDHAYQRVFVHSYAHETLRLLFDAPNTNTHWSRISLDPQGCLLLFDDAQTLAAQYSRSGNPLGTIKSPWPPSPPERTSAAKVTTEPPANEAPFFPTEGYWMSNPIDSGVYNCTWHRIEMGLPQFSPGTRVEVQTFVYSNIDAAPQSNRDPRWISNYVVTAPLQPPRGTVAQKSRLDEFLIQGMSGQYLSLLLKLSSDGFGTPVVNKLRVHYPRESYLTYLPPLYSADEPMRAFLDSFLSVFQTEWEHLEHTAADSTALFDLAAVPSGVAMNYLASWIGLDLEGTWDGEQNRRLLKAVPKIYPVRGTPAALRDYVNVYLTNFAGINPNDLASTSFPAFLEGFRERQHLLLSQSSGTLGHAQPLWGDSVVKRLQLDGLAEEGQVELVSTGQPSGDFFDYFAHRFRVYVPAAWVRTREQEAMLRRAIETELPAHVLYDLCLVQAGVRVGIQSTVGLDTIVGGPPAWRLPSEPDDSAPSLPALNHLGFGTFLSGLPGTGPAILEAQTQVENWILD
jgi:phage tail-like protein